MTESLRLQWLDGYLCVVVSTPGFQTPNLESDYWPAFKVHRTDPLIEGMESWEVMRGGASGGTSFLAKRPGGSWMNATTLRIPGDARSLKFESTPIPCPKVRAGIETRYRDSQWQKYTKTKGWVAA